ncbi:MAG: CBS domain-containing protein [Bacteroidales bacterium]|jgi:CBS domain-containing protein|nr:CBS domain-containing protein [Bacteroidales bacterium]
MLAKEILAKKKKQGVHKVYTINERASAFEAISQLDTLKIGSLLVLNDQNEILGIVSERDILYKCYNSGIPLKERNIKDLMTSKEDLIIGKLEDDTHYLRNVMTQKRIRHLPIIDEMNQLAGIISTGDIIKNELEATASEARLLREHIKNPFGIHLFENE